ncbi:putative retroelement pol polyprotein [Cucumis melo var. makuwa]|uniref:Retroelement pol polyprotein n=1 Tax=Cucumis melo var. makuwa TaxID=1194695 RepID=A0A5D3BSA0_CUCMM|nr:putative retroelement pol polyprotein [Cucumis melo var. makuwa]TYK02621.1 putative retroelement pol polyprotein [Cucumis melo var. makuwa]
MVVSKHWPLVTLDVKNAFLHGDPFEEVYTDMLLGYKQCATFQGEKMVCELYKSIYGLKQASKQWFAKFSMFVVSLGFQQSKDDYSLFVKAKDPPPVYFNHRDYAMHLLEDDGLIGAKPTSTPMDPSLKLVASDKDILHDQTGYQRVIGHLLYLSISRPDIISAVQKLSQFMAKPTKAHMIQTVH